MSKNKNAVKEAKKAAWAAKKEQEGNKVVAWIIGILIGLGVAYLIATFFMF